MLEWRSVFADNMKPAAPVETSDDRAGILARFETAKDSMMVGEEPVISMWVVDYGSEQNDVIAVAGDRLPDGVAQRHQNYRAGRK